MVFWLVLDSSPDKERLAKYVKMMAELKEVSRRMKLVMSNAIARVSDKAEAKREK
jgi:hypothetical protein